MTRTHVWRLAASALFAAAVVGCGGDSDDVAVSSSGPSGETPAESPADTGPTTPTESPGAPIDRDSDGADLCTLFENLDLAALLAEEPGEPIGGGGRCLIESAADDSTGKLDVGVRDRGQAAFVQTRAQLGFESEPYGLGDEAFVSGSGIHVLAGERYIDLQVIRDPFGTTPPPTEDELIAAMRTVLTNLGMD